MDTIDSVAAEVNRKAIGKRIEEIRKRYGSLKFMEVFGVDTVTVKRWESGEGLPGCEIMKTIAILGETTVEKLTKETFVNDDDRNDIEIKDIIKLVLTDEEYLGWLKGNLIDYCKRGDWDKANMCYNEAINTKCKTRGQEDEY